MKPKCETHGERYKGILLSMRMVAFLTAFLASLWNLTIIVAVTFDEHWVTTRAAGGQFEHFPLAIRVIYGVEALLIIAQIYFTYLLTVRSGAWNIWSWQCSRILIGIYLLSAVFNGLSRSADEKLNSPVALILVWSLIYLAGRERPIAR